jgi:hypothetical protein
MVDYLGFEFKFTCCIGTKQQCQPILRYLLLSFWDLRFLSLVSALWFFFFPLIFIRFGQNALKLLNNGTNKHCCTDQDGYAAETVGRQAALHAVTRKVRSSGRRCLKDRVRKLIQGCQFIMSERTSCPNVEWPKVEDCLYLRNRLKNWFI